MKQKNTIETQTWEPEHLIDMYEDVHIQDVINKLQTLMADGYTHVRGKPKTMYDSPTDYSFAHEMIEEFVFFKEMIFSVIHKISNTIIGLWCFFVFLPF